MRKRRIKGSRSAVWRLFDRHGIGFRKKSLRAAEQERPDVARARRRWIREQGMFNSAQLVFIDETSTSTNMARLRGRCRRGKRLIGRVPHGHWKTVTLVAGLRHNKMVAPFVVDGPMNRATFLVYLKRCLRPFLKRGDFVIIDNLPAHKGAAVESNSSRRPAQHCFTCQSTRRSQSDRTGVQQTEGASAQGCRAKCSSSLSPNWKTGCQIQRQRMQKLLHPVPVMLLNDWNPL